MTSLNQALLHKQAKKKKEGGGIKILQMNQFPQCIATFLIRYHKV